MRIYVSLLPNVCSLATGGSAMKAVEVLKEHNVPEDRIIFINLVKHTETVSIT
jgi:uracil phosphoribosyltransferase